MRHTVSAIIPSFNEEKNIRYVLEQVSQERSIQEIICVDDGSYDQTIIEIDKRKQKTGKIAIINLERNYGKAYAVAQGIKRAKGDIIVLLDADLHGLTTETFRLLLNPLFEHTHDATVGYPGSMIDTLFKPIGGQRAYFRKDLEPFLENISQKGYGMELFLNYIFRNQKVKSIALPNVRHVLKHKKYPLQSATKSYFIAIKEIFSEIFIQDDPLFYFANTYLFPFYFKRSKNLQKS